jgi:uncharacterized protein
LICQRRGEKKTRLARLVIFFNNWRISRSKARISPENILLLLPRCLQFSDCKQNVTKDIANCKGCGRCKIKDLVQLAEELKVKAFVATGGRIALSKVQEPWVKGVVAIACGTELKAGILSSAKPVMAIENLRPCGPCTDTDVDMTRVREGMLRFIGSNECEHP